MTELQTTPSPSDSVRRVFITGAATSMGRAVVRHLSAAGHKVIGTGAGHQDASLIRADGGLPAYPGLRRAGEVRSAMTTLGRENLVVVNLAAMAANQLPFMPVNWAETADLLVEGTAALVAAAKEAGAVYFVQGSFAFADLHSDDEAVQPVIDAVTRAEALVIESGLTYAILRFGYAYGDVPELKTLIASVKAGRPVFTSGSHAHAGFIHVQDAAAAIAAAIASEVNGARLNVVDDHPAAPAAFLGYFCESQGLGAPAASPLTAPLARLALGAAQYGLLNAAAHPSNADAKTLLGWQPRFTTYRQGIDDVLLSWRAAMQVS
ncbi:MAG: NAD(P)-dependent oxidoreductase [bacterium]|nr:NAD(P)-dependent oxidoreductase [bacterium]